jgi:phosphoglycolate phosphatase
MVVLQTESGVTLKDIDLIIFDKDGTLFELYPYWSKIAQSRAEIVCRMLGEDSSSLVNEIVHLLGVRSGVMNREGPMGIHSRDDNMWAVDKFLRNRGYSVTPRLIRESFEGADRHVNDPGVLHSALVPVPGIVEFLSALSGRCKCAVYSGDKRNSIKNSLDLMQYSKYFSIIAGSDDVLFPKPNPWGVIMIHGLSGIKPKNTLMIGDSLFDFQCSKNSNCGYSITRKSDISDPALELLSDAMIEDFTEIEVIS